MNTNNKTTISDVIPDRTNIALMTLSAMHALEMGLYSYAALTVEQHHNLHAFIKGFISNSSDPYKAYAEFCQRVMMASHYIQQNPKRYPWCSPEEWLDPSNPQGFAGTKRWFLTLTDKRKNMPLHLLELKAFPEALLELAEETTPEIFHYWANWFRERDAMDCYYTFNLVASRLCLGIYDEDADMQQSSSSAIAA